jgi:hypothetical protein
LSAQVAWNWRDLPDRQDEGIRNAMVADISTEGLVSGVRTLWASPGGCGRQQLGNDRDVVLKATVNPDIGARVAMRAIPARKHVVMLNVETDVVVGPILYKMAQAAGVV